MTIAPILKLPADLEINTSSRNAIFKQESTEIEIIRIALVL